MKLAIAVCVALAALTGTAAADGLYLRFGVGPEFAHGSLDAAVDSTSNGAGIATQIAVGYALSPSLVLGVGTFPAVTPKPSYSGVDAGGQHVSATGPFVDYFATRAIHVFAGVLFAAGYLDGGERDAHVGFGIGGTLGAGYDRAISEHWSIGGALRVTGYRLYGVDDSLSLIAPAALITIARR